MSELVITFLALLALAIVIGRVIDWRERRQRQRPVSGFERHMMVMTAAFQDVQMAIGEQLLPVMQQTTTAFQQFAEALRKEEE